jgi:hypothetical protein
MAGPLPKEGARRRNAPTIPTTSLPAGGRKGAAPRVPSAYKLNASGRAYWKWAWATPQAAAWDSGALYVVARRAQLESDLAALTGDKIGDAKCIAEMLQIPLDKKVRELADLFGDIKRLASGEVQLMKEMRELDNRLGLNPKAMADLRWKIVADDVGPEKQSKGRRSASNVVPIRAVDPSGA